MVKSKDMLQLPYNLKIIRGTTGLNQTDFGKMFKVSLAMQKSYEIGKANPDGLYLQRISSFTGIPEDQLKNKKIKETDIGTKAELGEKEQPFEDSSVVTDQQLLIEILIDRVNKLELEVARIKHTMNKTLSPQEQVRGAK